MTMYQLFVVTIGIVALSVMLIGINVFFFKRKFPETEIGRNKDMIRLGIRCPQCEERKNFRRSKRPAKIHIKNMRPDWNTLRNK
jgi:hypothetical protein